MTRHRFVGDDGKPTRGRANCSVCGLRRVFAEQERVSWTPHATVYTKKTVPLYGPADAPEIAAPKGAFKPELPACRGAA